MNLGFDFNSLQGFGRTAEDLRREKIFEPDNIKMPLRKIECESIADDFYSNLIDWAVDVIYYSVSDSIYAYNFHSEVITKIFQSQNSTITCIKYNKQNSTLCVGSSSGLLTLIDTNTLKSVKHLFHRSRIGVLETVDNQIITGSRDKKSKVIDLRSQKIVGTYLSHAQEVCGLSISHNGGFLASGGNDNKVFVYDVRNAYNPFAKLCDHVAAVKALSWSPIFQSQLVSGGGTADKTIKHWDLSTKNHLVKSYDFESQICNLKWLQSNKVLSTFGYSNDDIKLLNDFKVEKKYTGHKNRVIHFSVDSTETYFASGSGDSTVRVWEIAGRSMEDEIKIR